MIFKMCGNPEKLTKRLWKLQMKLTFVHMFSQVFRNACMEPRK